MGLYITAAGNVEERVYERKAVSRHLSLKRLSPGNRRYLISLGFKVKKENAITSINSRARTTF